MDDLLIQRRMRMPVVTGVPTSPEAVRSFQPQTGTSFRDVLEQEAQKTTELSFSRHAAGRVAERGIEISHTGMERLEEGLRMAREIMWHRLHPISWIIPLPYLITGQKAKSTSTSGIWTWN